ncbi:MAG: hypothetical protein HKN67_00150 [Saprospiraceae bacterium]|nr:hypothetical protein [Saprospiraceae bacterium]
MSQVLILAVCLLFSSQLFSQAEQGRKLSHEILLTGSYKFSTEEFGVPGIAYELGYRINDLVAIEMQTGYRNWSDERNRVFPVQFGPSFYIIDNGKWETLAQFSAGPALIVGNDYASIFGHFELGLKFVKINPNNSGLLFGLSFSQGMAFHPDNFSYINIKAGYRF